MGIDEKNNGDKGKMMTSLKINSISKVLIHDQNLTNWRYLCLSKVLESFYPVGLRDKMLANKKGFFKQFLEKFPSSLQLHQR